MEAQLTESQIEESQVEEEVEVPFAPDADVDQEQEQAPAAEKPQEDILDTIEPKADPRTWTFGPPDMERTYVQKPLSFIAKMQWFSLVGDVLDRALSGDGAMSINSLFSAPGNARPGALRAEDFRDADTFVQAVGKLLTVAPDFLVRSYMIWLNVPDYERELVGQMMELPPDEGGLTDDQGMEIIETFLDQNYDALVSFFGERLTKIQARVTKLNQLRAAKSRRSKR